jgi:broad specificity phosphatase PhoE
VATTLLLARHGETDWNRAGRFQGNADPPLNDTGLRQAVELARAIDGEPLDAIYASDLRRAVQTAAAVADRVALPVNTRPDLREADVGRFTGLTRQEIAARFPEDARVAEEHGYTFASGEGLESLERRVLDALQEIARAHPDGSVLVVTHGGPLRVVLAHADGTSVDEHRLRFPPVANGGLHRLRITNGVLRRLD